MKNVLFVISALLATGCDNSFVNGYFAKLPSPGQLQFGAPSTSIMGQTWSAYTSFDVGTQPFGATSKSVIYLSNIGQLPAGIQAMWVDSTSTNYYSVQSQCQGNIPANSVPCQVTVSYAPMTIGSTPATLHVTYTNGNGGNAETSMPLSGSGSNLAYLQFQQSSLVAPSDTASSNGAYITSVTYNVIYNGSALGAAGLQIDPAQGVMISNPSDSSFTIDSAGTTCGAVINANCVVKVDFSAPTAAVHSGNFILSYFNGAEVLSLPATVSGTGLTAEILATLSANALNFPSQVVAAPSPVPQVITVNYSGSVPATNVVITPPSDPDFTLSTDPTKSTCYANAATPGGQIAMINGNCTLSVTFNPATFTTYNSSIGVAYLSNSQARTPISIPISGTGVHPALLSPNTTTLAFNNDPAHESQGQSFTLTNGGGVAPTSVSALTNSDPTDFNVSFGNSCGSASPNGGTCSINVGFNPQSAAALSTQISFTYYDGRATQTVSLSATGTGTAPLVVTGGSTIDFGYVMIGGGNLPSAQSRSLGIYGTTAGSLTISPSQLSSPFTFPGGFPGTGGNCSTSVNPNSSNSCNFSVGVTTDSGFTAGTPVTQPFSIAYAGNGGNGTGSLSFTAKMTPENPPVLAFGASPSFPTLSVGNSETETFTISNNSPYFATAWISTGTLSAPFSIASNNCNGGVSANGSCQISVKFLPTAAGTFSGTLNYTYSDTISNHTISAAFSAVGSAAITLVPNTTTIDFGNVYVGDTVNSQTISLQYFGAENWTFTGPSSVTSPFSVSTGTCGNQASCQLTISLNTSAQITSANQTMNFTYSPALASGSIPITLKANIQYRQATLGLSSSNFPNTLQGSQNSQTLTLTNNGSGTASSLTVNQSMTPPNLGFSFSGGSCLTMASLAAGQSCTLNAVFAPTAVGNASASFSVSAVSAGSPTPVSTSFSMSGNGTQLIQVYAGGYQTCITDELDNAVCWGRNTSGQLGQGNTNTLSTQPKQMSKISFGSGVQVVKLAVGDSHTCALLNTPAGNGQVSCWGSNGNGRLGLGSTASAISAPIQSGSLQVVNLGTDSSSNPEVATDIEAGFEHTCALLKSGKIKCWGGNGSGQLGIGSTQDIGSSSSQMGNALEAVNLAGATPVGVSAGAGHSCAALVDGGSKCWGDNYFGQLGQGVSTQFIGTGASDMAGLQEILLGSSAKVSAIDASSGAFTCSLLKDGTVKCFGETDYSGSATQFWGVLGTCWARPIYNSAAVPCWSNPTLTQTTSMGYYSTDMGDDLPVVSLPSTVSQLSLGSQFVCTLEGDSSVRCWGANDHGQLGIGNNNNIGAGQNDMGANLAAALSSTIIGAGVQPVSISAGYEHVCSVLSNNTLKCWGTGSENATGLAGFGVTTDTGGSSATSPNSLQVVYDGR